MMRAEQAERLARVCRAYRLQPSEARALTLVELAAFDTVARAEADAMRRR